MNGSLQIEDYSNWSFVVRGDTKEHKVQLKNLGGKWNPNLKGGAGWIFKIGNIENVKNYIRVNCTVVSDKLDSEVHSTISNTPDSQVGTDNTENKYNTVNSRNNRTVNEYIEEKKKEKESMEKIVSSNKKIYGFLFEKIEACIQYDNPDWDADKLWYETEKQFETGGYRSYMTNRYMNKIVNGNMKDSKKFLFEKIEACIQYDNPDWDCDKVWNETKRQFTFGGYKKYMNIFLNDDSKEVTEKKSTPNPIISLLVFFCFILGVLTFLCLVGMLAKTGEDCSFFFSSELTDQKIYMIDDNNNNKDVRKFWLKTFWCPIFNMTIYDIVYGS